MTYKDCQKICRSTCSRYVYGRGYCRKHGQEFYRWGSGEQCADFKPSHRKRNRNSCLDQKPDEGPMLPGLDEK